MIYLQIPLFAYDAENRLTSILKNGQPLAAFTYDGDGVQVAATVNGVTAKYVGGIYEVEVTNVTKYYLAGMNRVAMRSNGVLNYLLSDHLGSTALMTDNLGNIVSEQRYKAWGETRYSSSAANTDYLYTGQREVSDIGLYFYKARWYDSSLGRFSQADTIVPGAGDPRAWDRYAYVKNSPVVYNDPSGHLGCWDDNSDDSFCEGKTVNKNGIVNKQIIPVRQPVQTPLQQSNTPYSTQIPLVPELAITPEPLQSSNSELILTPSPYPDDNRANGQFTYSSAPIDVISLTIDLAELTSDAKAPGFFGPGLDALDAVFIADQYGLSAKGTKYFIIIAIIEGAAQTAFSGGVALALAGGSSPTGPGAVAVAIVSYTGMYLFTGYLINEMNNQVILPVVSSIE
jgi:RHS repeat-associated protein